MKAMETSRLQASLELIEAAREAFASQGALDASIAASLDALSTLVTSWDAATAAMSEQLALVQRANEAGAEALDLQRQEIEALHGVAYSAEARALRSAAT